MTTSAKSPKLTKARREYTCRRCRRPIARGESYLHQVVTCGSPGTRTVEARDGFPTVVEHGFRARARICEACVLAPSRGLPGSREAC